MAENTDPTDVSPATEAARARTGRTRKCRGCKRTIARGLTKCPHCELERGLGSHLLIWGSRAGALVALIGIPAAFMNFYGLFDSWRPAKIDVLLTSCTQDRIVLKTINSGGQSATVGHPTFIIHSPRRNIELRMPAYVDNVPADAGVIAPNVPALQTYNARSIFFNSEESRGRACKIHVSVPVVPDRGTHPDAAKDCTCVYR